MLRQSDAKPDDVKSAVAAVRKLKDAPGFIVDLRAANGGNELFALEIAKVFCASPTVYAKSKYRNHERHDVFGETRDRILPATEQAYTRPVVCLIGPGAISSGEGFVQMMKCLRQVTTVGLPTRGASGNPKPVALSRTGLTVYFSTWVDMLPDGQPIEGVGIPPDTRVEVPASAYATADPTLEKGLEVLRASVMTAKP
jgi:C-terminal processing protease CtpA/Prc